MRKWTLISLVLLALAAFAMPTFGDVYPPYNTAAGSSHPEYSVGLPAWATSPVVASLAAPMTGDFKGTVTSSVYYLNTVDASGGLGFVYQFDVDDYKEGTGLVRASFAADPRWQAYSVADFGSDESGDSSKYGPSGWENGAPQFIALNAINGAPVIQFNDGVGIGTILNKPADYSALIWFETNAKNWGRSFTGLQDSGNTGKADLLIVPVPGAVLLGAMGLGLVGWVKRRFA